MSSLTIPALRALKADARREAHRIDRLRRRAAGLRQALERDLGCARRSEIERELEALEARIAQREEAIVARLRDALGLAPEEV